MLADGVTGASHGTGDNDVSVHWFITPEVIKFELLAAARLDLVEIRGSLEALSRKVELP
jgi:hypothetical protein